MKIFAYNVRPDEAEFFDRFSAEFGLDVTQSPEPLRPDTLVLAQGCDAIDIITTPVTAPMLEQMKQMGIRFITTRTIGYDHIDIEHARSLGLSVGAVSYSPDSVADYAIMLMLMTARRMKPILQKSAAQDFSLNGVRGRQLPNLTVGVIGTGRIGRTVITHLQGFGCPILAYDPFPSEAVVQQAQYVPLKELIEHSDIITLHLPATEQSYHMIGRDSLARMKDGVMIVNTARGALIDSDALIEAIESGKVGGAALDVVEDEANLYYNNLSTRVVANRTLALLRSFPNVIVTPHTAFFTDQAVSDMVEHSLHSCLLFAGGKADPHRIF